MFSLCLFCYEVQEKESHILGVLMQNIFPLFSFLPTQRPQCAAAQKVNFWETLISLKPDSIEDADVNIDSRKALRKLNQFRTTFQPVFRFVAILFEVRERLNSTQEGTLIDPLPRSSPFLVGMGFLIWNWMDTGFSSSYLELFYKTSQELQMLSPSLWHNMILSVFVHRKRYIGEALLATLSPMRKETI